MHGRVSDCMFISWHTLFFFFFNDTATTEIYTLSLHDALPICVASVKILENVAVTDFAASTVTMHVVAVPPQAPPRSEEHTSELQSQSNLVCRLLLEKKKKQLSRAHFILSTRVHYLRPQSLYPP